MDDQEMINTLRDMADKLEEDLQKKHSQWRLTFEMCKAAEVLGFMGMVEGAGINACTRDYDLYQLLTKLDKAFRSSFVEQEGESPAGSSIPTGAITEKTIQQLEGSNAFLRRMRAEGKY